MQHRSPDITTISSATFRHSAFLREGDYEGTTGMAEYGHPAPYGYAIEEQIAEKVHELIEQTRP